MTRTVRRRRPIQVLLIVAILPSAGLAASPVSANAPERFGPNTYEGSFIGFECPGFDILIQGAGSDRLTVFFDGSGDVVKVVYFGRFPHDVLTADLDQTIIDFQAGRHDLALEGSQWPTFCAALA